MQAKIKRVALLCILLFVNVNVACIAYNILTAEKGAPLWASVAKNPTLSLFKTAKAACLRRASDKSNHRGLITGTLCNGANNSAAIGGQVLREGDIAHGVKIVSITRAEVKFEKNGRTWIQRVQEPPDSAWWDK